MKIKEFIHSDLELVTVSELEVGDVFSYVQSNKEEHCYIRTILESKHDESYPEVIFTHEINSTGRVSKSSSRPDVLVTRVKRFAPYNPEQQPYNEDDI